MVEMTTKKAAEALENMARTIDSTANAMCVNGHIATAEDMAAKADALRLGAAALRGQPLAATVAGLRGALEAIQRWEGMKHREDTAEVCYNWCPLCRLEAALAASPAEHAARIQAAALRGIVNAIEADRSHTKDSQDGAARPCDVKDSIVGSILAEADRLEKAVVA